MQTICETIHMRSLSYMFSSNPFRFIEPQVDSSCINHLDRPLSLVPDIFCNEVKKLVVA